MVFKSQLFKIHSTNFVKTGQIFSQYYAWSLLITLVCWDTIFLQIFKNQIFLECMFITLTSTFSSILESHLKIFAVWSVIFWQRRMTAHPSSYPNPKSPKIIVTSMPTVICIFCWHCTLDIIIPFWLMLGMEFTIKAVSSYWHSC